MKQYFYLIICIMLLYFFQEIYTMDDMPIDPVTGSMVMTSEYKLHLQYGQSLRFASSESLAAFQRDPHLGLRAVVDISEDNVVSSHVHDTTSLACPVCGMATTSGSIGPQVLPAHGEQTIHACSLKHAEAILANIAAVIEAGEDTQEKEKNINEFCAGSGVTMQNGFQFLADKPQCLVLWFPSWVLNTSWKYTAACLFIAIVAIFNEYVLYVRRILRNDANLQQIRQMVSPEIPNEATSLLESKPNIQKKISSILPFSKVNYAIWFRQCSPSFQHIIHSLLHGFTILVAYLLMLISMTYDWCILLSCIVGYVLGHYYFGPRREVAVDDEDEPLNISSAY